MTDAQKITEAEYHRPLIQEARYRAFADSEPAESWHDLTDAELFSTLR